MGICIAALSAETIVQNGMYIYSSWYYALIFFATVVYYTYAYAGEVRLAPTTNIRLLWYQQNKTFIRFTQVLYSIVIITIAVIIFLQYHDAFFNLSLTQWLLVNVFPAVALLYYGFIFFARSKFNLRSIGWLKPFVIGFVCTGVVTVFPLFFHSLVVNKPYHFSLPHLLYFMANWLFTSVIAIMFDIKDFASDYNHRLKTVVVSIGLRKTIFFILLPLIAVGYIFFAVFAFLNHFTWLRLFINLLPFILLAIAAWSLQRRKKILYYLAVIDGLLLIKAACGFAGVWVGK